MRVLLVSGNREEINMVSLPLGLALVAEAARLAGHEVRMLDLLGVEDPGPLLAGSIAEHGPEVIGLSVRNIDDQNMAAPRLLLDQVREVVEVCRRHSRAPIVAGGAGYSIFPDSALSYLGADMGLAGDGEDAFPALLARLAQGGDPAGVPGLWLPGHGLTAPRAFPRDLDRVPLAAAARWFGQARRADLWLPVQSRRGCPMACSYCSTPVIEGKAIRRRSVSSFTQGLAELMATGYGQFYFTDNVFNLPPGHALELCRALARLDPKPRWRCILYPGGLKPELVEAMAGAGCVEASLGFESGSRPVLRGLGKRFALEEVRSARALLAGQGIRCMGFLLLGGPGETRASVEESLAFAESLKLDMLKLTIGIRIYPGTDLARLAVAQGMIPPEDSLLLPRFYLEPGLNGWLKEKLAAWRAGRPHWVM